MNKEKLVQSAILGHIIGDAVGVPVEFVKREKLKNNPLNAMLAGGSRRLPSGTWSDDSSMTLCTMKSMIDRNHIDFDDMMEKFLLWVEEGYMTPQGRSFGIGKIVLRALTNYHETKDILQCGCGEEEDNGNGSLMRILPITLFLNFDGIKERYSLDEKLKIIYRASAITHSHIRSKIACGIYYLIVEELLIKCQIESVLFVIEKAEQRFMNDREAEHFKRIFSKDFRELDEEEIFSTGYVVHTLEASLWCLLNSNNYRNCILKAVNLGGDTDTIAAIAGGLAGILYGIDEIPEEWVKGLVNVELIKDLCRDFAGIEKTGEE